MIFYILFGILFFLSLIYYSGKKYPFAQTAYLHFCVFCLFLIIAGGRNNVGTDWWQYKEVFDTYVIDYNYVHGSFEVLFYGFTGFIAKFSSSFNVFIFSLFLLSFFLKYRFIIDNSSNVFFSFLIYLSGVFLIFDINALRQGVALGFTLLSCTFIFKKNYLIFFLLILLATLFHSSAVVFLLAYFFTNFRLSNKKYVICTLVLSVLGYYISAFISDILVLGISDSNIADKFEYYSSGNYYVSKVSFFSVSTLRRIVLWGAILYLTRNIKDKNVYFYKNCLLFSFFLYFLFASSLEAAYRISYYFFCFEILLLPLGISQILNKNNRIMLLSFFCCYYFYLTYKLVSVPDGGLFIYNNIFF